MKPLCTTLQFIMELLTITLYLSTMKFQCITPRPPPCTIQFQCITQSQCITPQPH